MKRVLAPEWLDALPPEDPAAIGSRRDLRRINRVMGHAAILRRLLKTTVTRPPVRIVEFGAGDGSLMLLLAQKLAPLWPRVEVILVDRHPAVTETTRAEFRSLGWSPNIITDDVFEWLARATEPTDIVVANLFLHHFTQDRLTQLLRLASRRATILAACEPRRAAFPLAFSGMVRLIGCNAVTRHDAAISVRAGFAGRELSVLWPADGRWRLREENAGWFSHAFLAQRLDAP